MTTLHLCLDVTVDRAGLAHLLRAATELNGERSLELHDALVALAEAVEGAPEVPEATLFTMAGDEAPGEGLRVTDDSAVAFVRAGVGEALRVVPAARVARLAVVIHLVPGADAEGDPR